MDQTEVISRADGRTTHPKDDGRVEANLGDAGSGNNSLVHGEVDRDWRCHEGILSRRFKALELVARQHLRSHQLE
jgi:hypothetical protein